MTKETKQQEKEKPEKIKQKDTDPDFFDEFKKEITDRKRKNTPAVLLAVALIVVVFGLLGVGIYQIFFKQEKTATGNKPAEEKIENRPESNEQTKKDEQKNQETQPPQNTQTPTPTPTQPAYTEYDVQSGDTWSSVANANGMSSQKLMEYNGTTSEDLQIGQKIKIPKN